MDNAPLQAVQHPAALVMGQEVPHDVRGEVTDAVHNNVGLQWLQEDPLSHHILQQPSVQLVK